METVSAAAVSVIAPSPAPPVPFESSFAPSLIVITGAVSEIFPPPAFRITFGLTVQDILAYSQNGGEAQRYLRKAKAVLVCPSIFKMGFVIGGSGGGCTLLARGGRGSWSAPAFYHMGSGSVGAQVGIQDAELVLFILTQKGLRAIEDSQFKFGESLLLALVLTGISVALFVWGLGLPYRLFGSF